MYKPSEKKKINRIDDHKHWPASIKSTIQWFPFHTIMEHTGNITQDYKHLISSLLKIFSMLEIRLSFGDKDLDALSIKCINCKRETGLNSETTFAWVYDEVITKFVLNAMLHHVDMSWIISSNQEMEYEMNTKNNHLDWSNEGHRQEQTNIISCVLWLLVIGWNQIIKTMKTVSVVEQYQMMQQ